MEEWKEAIEAAVNKTIGAWNKASEAFLSHDQKGFEHWHNEFNRYVETFSHAIGIPEEDFISYLEEKGLYKNNANQKSE